MSTQLFALWIVRDLRRLLTSWPTLTSGPASTVELTQPPLEPLDWRGHLSGSYPVHQHWFLSVEPDGAIEPPETMSN